MKHKIKLKWKVYAYLFGFTAILIGILWIMQTVYLDDFYRYIKMKDHKSAIKTIEESIDKSDIESIVSTVAKNYDICVRITDTEGNDKYSADTKAECTIHKLSKYALNRLYNEAVKNDGEYSVESKDLQNLYSQNNDRNTQKFPPLSDSMQGTLDTISKDNYSSKHPEGIEFDKFQGIERRNLELEGVIKVDILTTSSGEKLVLYTNSIITPVDATVYTIRVQLIFISVILVVLALFMASFISNNISKSLSRVNNSAKELAKGEFDVEFTGNDYREIAELSNTLNYAAKELGKADEIQRELIANVSHDLRTPLTMITAYSEVMRDLPGENNPENVQVIIDEAKRLSMLVNDLLDVSKLQAGVDNMNIDEYCITESIKKVMDRYAKLVEQDGYKILFNYYETVMVKADEFKIFQVIYNLVNNAINYTGEDKTVTVNQIVNGDVVRIEVTDTGIGIPEDEIKNVWERYYKLDKNHKRTIVGTGLGLSIVKNILNKHNARYGVISEVGHGSTFWFELEKSNIEDKEN